MHNMNDEATWILEILETENIRLIDGRWSGGYVKLDALNDLISSGEVEIYRVEGFTFARKKQE